MLNIAIFASGKGSNADNLARYFNLNHHPLARVNLILCDRKQAGVFDVATTYSIDSVYLSSLLLQNPFSILKIVHDHEIDFIVLAGYLKLMPIEIIEAFPMRMINIHPALLPKFGGKGMYGMKVHQAVVDSGEKETGISIHYVNAHYDKGDIIFQAKIRVDKEDSPIQIGEKIHVLEQTHLPKIVEDILYNL